MHDESKTKAELLQELQVLRERLSKVEASEARYALAAEGANDGLWDWDLLSNQVYYAPRWKELLGLDSNEIEPSPETWFSRVPPPEREKLRLSIESHLQGEAAVFRHDHRIIHSDGAYRWVLCQATTARDEHGKALRFAGTLTDITDRKRTEEQLRREVFHDALTDLPNRVLFMDRLAYALARTKRRPDYQFAVLFLDLDHFKIIHERLGPRASDQLILTIAQRLKACLRYGDTIARLEAGEFAVILDELRDASDAMRVADRIYAALSLPLSVDGREVVPTVHVGIVLNSPGYTRPEDMVRHAEMALHRAETMQRGRFEMFDPDLHERVVNSLALERDMQGAIERDEFFLHYQPVVSLESGQVSGFEALVRWKHPQRGVLYPADFITLVDRAALSLPLGWWVLRQACAQLREWQRHFKQPALTMSVNLFSEQFWHPDLVDQLGRILSDCEVAPQTLRLEITEEMLAEHTDSASLVLAQLRDLGVELHLDDLGLGYASLSALHRFSVDGLKVDRSCISRAGNGGQPGDFARSIAALAPALGLRLIAEGVETAEQLARLKGFGYAFGQGYYFARPMAPETVVEFLETDPRW